MREQTTRRRYLVVAAGGVTGVAGCLGGSGDDGDEGNTSDDDGEPRQPEIVTVSMLQNWEGYGDALLGGLSSIPAGSALDIAVRFAVTPTDEMTAQVFQEVQISGTDTDEQVASDSKRIERAADREDFDQFESAITFETEGWGPGEYRAAVTIRDETTGEATETETVTFDLT